MRNNFKGWSTVYAFTFIQSTKSVSFRVITALIAFIIFGGFIAMNLVIAKPEKSQTAESTPIKSVYVLDSSGLQKANYKDILSQNGDKEFQYTEFINAAGKFESDVVKTARENSPEAIAVIISANNSGYELKAIIPKDSKIKKKQAQDLLRPMTTAFESNKLMQAGLSNKQLAAALKPTVVSYSEVGESTSKITKIIKIAAPMVFSFLMYFMLLLYGQTASKSVSTEKTTKLMETLLTSVHPYAMITGKVLAVTSMALLQFVTWIFSAFVGLYAGNAIAHGFYPQYQNTAITIINYLKDNIGETAFTFPAVLLAIIFFCLGFVYYSAIAAVAGCMVSKPEDVAATQSVLQLPVIISWLICYIAPLLGKDKILAVARYIPFTSPFIVPADLITGTMGLIEGLIATAILLIFSLLIVILAARIYKGLVLYNGQKLSFRMIGNVLRSNR